MSLKAFQLHGCSVYVLAYKRKCIFHTGLFSWMQIPCWGLSWIFCAVLRVQFITLVHYSICWTLSTWIIESYASVINYIVHIHNLHFSVYSFAIKIHCLGTIHTRSYIENKLICKYFFLYSQLFYQILHFFRYDFYGFWCPANLVSSCLSHKLTYLFFYDKYLLADSGRQ